MNRVSTEWGAPGYGKEYIWMYYTDPATGKIGYSDPYDIGPAGDDDEDFALKFSINGKEAFASDGSKLTFTNTFGQGHTHGSGKQETGVANRPKYRYPNSFSPRDIKSMRNAFEAGTWNYYTLGAPDGSIKEWTPEYDENHPGDKIGEGGDFFESASAIDRFLADPPPKSQEEVDEEQRRRSSGNRFPSPYEPYYRRMRE